MPKAQIVFPVAEKFEISKKMASAIIDEVAALAISETKKTGSFTLPGIGKLVLVKRKARMERNPATGAEIKIPAKTVVKMRIAKAAKAGLYRVGSRDISIIPGGIIFRILNPGWVQGRNAVLPRPQWRSLKITFEVSYKLAENKRGLRNKFLSP